MDAVTRGTVSIETVSLPTSSLMLLLLVILRWSYPPARNCASTKEIVTIVTILAVALLGGLPAPVYAAERGRGVPAFNDVPAKTKGDRQQMREGSLIPPTTGKIVNVGRRWAFVPTNAAPSNNDEDVVSSPSRSRSSLAVLKSKPRQRPFSGGTPSFAVATISRPTKLVRTDSSEKDNDEELNIPHLLIAENLMLQRIVEAIRADNSDDHWTVSGEVTEFFKENRLIIKTAQRANMN